MSHLEINESEMHELCGQTYKTLFEKMFFSFFQIDK